METRVYQGHAGPYIYHGVDVLDYSCDMVVRKNPTAYIKTLVGRTIVVPPLKLFENNW